MRRVSDLLSTRRLRIIINSIQFKPNHTLIDRIVKRKFIIGIDLDPIALLAILPVSLRFTFSAGI